MGNFFVDALTAIVPVLVLILVCAAFTKHKNDSQAHMGPEVLMHVFGTFAAALVAVVASYMFPVTLHLTGTPELMDAPDGLAALW